VNERNEERTSFGSSGELVFCTTCFALWSILYGNGGFWEG
jgi:hypothetical protein